MGFGPVPPEHTRRLDPADRRRGPRAGAARQAHRRAAAGPADRAADRRSPASRAGHRLRVARQPRSAARPRRRPASGEAVARRLGVPALSAEQVGLAEHGWAGETPLWFYILKEADVLHDGDRLGPVGGRIVGEVLVGIIDADPESFRSVDPAGRRRCRPGAPAPSAWPTSWFPATDEALRLGAPSRGSDSGWAGSAD